MLRVNSNNVIVVPPFECAWLSGSSHELKGGAGCVSFEVKGENDVTVIFKPQAGGKRWQSLLRQDQAGGNGLLEPATEQNYTVILGSHRNSRLKFEKNGVTHSLVEHVPGAHVNGQQFTRYWIDINNGVISVGTGAPGTNLSYRWCDPDGAIPNLQHVGLSCWDKHVSYRNIIVEPPLSPAALHTPHQPPAAYVPPLLAITSAAITASLTCTNACTVACLAELLLPATQQLYASCVEHVASHFEQVAALGPAGGLCLLPAAVLADVLRHPELAVQEQQVWEAVLAWANYGQAQGGSAEAQPCRPPAELAAVLPLVRFPLMGAAALAEVARSGFAQRQPLVQELVAEALAAQSQPDSSSSSSSVPQSLGSSSSSSSSSSALFAVENRRHVRPADAARAVRYQRRKLPACRELMYVCDGDRNGVIRFIGTAFGRQEWVNPVLARRLEVRASSPASRYTDPKAIVSGHFLRTSFAGPRYEGGRPTAWWQVDLGAQHRLMCNYYTVRQDGSSDCMRHWLLQGSLDLVNWVDLRRHINDSTIKMPGQYGSWPVLGPAAAVPFRAFRIVLAGPTTSVVAPYNLCLSYLELYGYFYGVGEGAECLIN